MLLLPNIKLLPNIVSCVMYVFWRCSMMERYVNIDNSIRSLSLCIIFKLMVIFKDRSAMYKYLNYLVLLYRWRSQAETRRSLRRRCVHQQPRQGECRAPREESHQNDAEIPQRCLENSHPSHLTYLVEQLEILVQFPRSILQAILL